MIWRGTELFQRALADGCDLRAGQLFDRLAFGWLVYDATTMERVGWGEARTMPAAQAAAEIAAEHWVRGDERTRAAIRSRELSTAVWLYDQEAKS